jgi:hypothetical protein
MPSGMGWSNNVGYAMTTNCALGAKYSDCNLDNENGIDVGSVVVSVDDQTFTVSVNPGYAISEYNIQVGSSLNTAASDRYQSYQTRGGILADGASVSSGVSFQSSDWFVMQVMVSVFFELVHSAGDCLSLCQSNNPLTRSTSQALFYLVLPG